MAYKIKDKDGKEVVTKSGQNFLGFDNIDADINDTPITVTPDLISVRGVSLHSSSTTSGFLDVNNFEADSEMY